MDLESARMEGRREDMMLDAERSSTLEDKEEGKEEERFLRVPSRSTTCAEEAIMVKMLSIRLQPGSDQQGTFTDQPLIGSIDGR